MTTRDTDIADDLKMKGLSEQLLVQTEELLELEKADMNEQLETARNNKEVLDEVDRVIQCEKNLIEIFQSGLNDHVQSIENDKKDFIKAKQDMVNHKEELKQCLEEIEQDEIKNDPIKKARKQETIDILYRMIERDKEMISICKNGPKIGKKAVKASKSLIKRHTERLERLTNIRNNIQSSIDYQIGDAEISRQNIAKYEAEIERYKREIEQDRKEI